MRPTRRPASVQPVSTHPAVALTGRRRAALLVALNLAVAGIYFTHLGHGIGLGGYRIDLDVYRTGARVLLHGDDLYGRLPRLSDGHQLPFTYPPFAALCFVPLAILGYGTANWLLTGVTIACVAASLWRFAASTPGQAGTRMRRLLPWALPAALLLEPVRSSASPSTWPPGAGVVASVLPVEHAEPLDSHRVGDAVIRVGDIAVHGHAHVEVTAIAQAAARAR